ncbi:hypothetical protein BC351_00645 [Paenibacillus ferrarius]|uniref:Uncharacterized protein n=1 Tax=Paenibacillus ferrarius TaxID=1469647 RepID=A0A1V4HS77_9BACL|nr:hypothetical protein [Paenibacillus ferrarius]OPH61781.1 hypothetical protein BC351_00645 [Paenibacillus ferrarius]
MTKPIIEQLKDTYHGDIEPTVLDFLFFWRFAGRDWFIFIANDNWVWTMDENKQILRDNWKIEN